MKVLLALALLASAFVPVGDAQYCAYLTPDVPPDVDVEECDAISASGRVSVYLDGYCITVYPVGWIPPVGVYDCDTGKSVVP